MQFKQFFLPAGDDGSALEECNRFLRAHKVLTVDRQFTTYDGGSGWAILIHYLQGTTKEGQKKSRIDYREQLSPEDFTLFSELRNQRKTMAEQEGLPVYAIFSNEQLAQIARGRITNRTDLAKLEGVGESKVEKYSSILDIVRQK